MSTINPQHIQSAGTSAPVSQNEVALGNEETSAGSNCSDAQVAPPPRKRARTKDNRSKKKEENTVSGISKLPVELFTEIMRELRPVDILNLSRTCKSFRAILMRRSSKPIWNRAAENLPYRFLPCPPWLSMPQYVSVVYTNACSACGGKSQRKESKSDPEFHPKLLIRLCITCQPIVLIPAGAIPKHLKKLVVVTSVDIFPGPGIDMNNGAHALRAEVQKISRRYNAKRKRLNEEAFNAWKRTRSRIIKKYSKRPHWDLIENIEEDRGRQKDDLKQQFHHGVEQRLKELGWEYDAFYVKGKEWQSLTYQPRNLTDRIWNNLYSKLQPILQEARSRRLIEFPLWQQGFLLRFWEKKLDDLGTRVIVHHRHVDTTPKPMGVRLAPPVFEATDWPYIKQILESCSSQADVEDRIPASWGGIRPLVETWQRDIESQLASRLRDDESFTKVSDPNACSLVISGRPNISGDLGVLLCADSVFRFADNTVRYFPDGFLEIWSLEEPWMPRATSPLTVEGAQSFTLARGLAKMLLQYLGCPNATHLSLNTCGNRFVCGACVSYDRRSASIYDWNGLLNHYINTSLNNLESDNTSLDPGDLALAKWMRTVHQLDNMAAESYPLVHILSVEDALEYTPNPSMLLTEKPWLGYVKKHTCVHCIQGPVSDLLVLLTHIQDTHHIEEPEAHRDFENYEVFIRQSLEATYEHKVETN
ncbi:unnamed protein product [Rhizoctonia solani]|uniref:F-box domain-containing protein n=1 Tax=Rhizoctonia solani TaxID=456999 RepID=A0A8H3CZD5_9AGAM|nr:unnamed protein product [Rhizoctonia solani]